MIKVLLADDEPIILRGLRKIIKWNDLGAEIIGEASTGRELIDAIHEKQPHIVISDICMPDQNGIDVIRYVKENQLDIKVIFISAHQEFKYAKDAIYYGALDYLVKPVDKQQLSQSVKKAIDLFELERSKTETVHKLAEFEQKAKKGDIEDFFKQVIEENIQRDSLEEKAFAMGLQFQQPLFTVLTMTIDRFYQSAWAEKEKTVALYGVSNIVEETTQSLGQAVIVQKSGNLCFIMNHAPLDVKEVAENIQQRVNDFLAMEVTIGIGSSVITIKELADSYNKSILAVERSYFTGGNSVISFDQVLHQADISEQTIFEKQQTVLKALISLQYKEYREKVDCLIELIGEFARGNRNTAVSMSYSSFQFIKNELDEMGILIEEDFMEAGHLLSAVHQQETFNMLKQFLLNLSDALYQYVKNSGTNKEVNQMRLIKEYMQEHFEEQITLEKLASMFYMNPYYFSSFFKKHTKQNFKTHLTEIRMKEALKLLVKSDLMVYEIAEKVGYNNARQFSDMFKKHYGTLPNEYRQIKLKDSQE